MNDVTPEVWITQEIQDLLDEGPVGLYEFVWVLNGTSYGLSTAKAIELSRRVVRKFIDSGQAEIFAVQWPTFEVVEGPLSPQVLDDPGAWSEGKSGPLMALLPTGNG